MVPFSALASFHLTKLQTASSRQLGQELAPRRPACTASTTPHRAQGPTTTTTKSDATATTSCEINSWSIQTLPASEKCRKQRNERPASRRQEDQLQCLEVHAASDFLHAGLQVVECGDRVPD